MADFTSARHRAWNILPKKWKKFIFLLIFKLTFLKNMFWWSKLLNLSFFFIFESLEMTFYALTMNVVYMKKNLWALEKFEILKFSKKQNISKFQIFQAPIKFFSCILRSWWGHKKSYLDFQKWKKKERLSNFDHQNMFFKKVSLKISKKIYFFHFWGRIFQALCLALVKLKNMTIQCQNLKPLNNHIFVKVLPFFGIFFSSPGL